MAVRRTKVEGERRSAVQAEGRCACGAVAFEIDVPAIWAWHDHSEAGRRCHGGAAATYVGSWKRRFRLLTGEDLVSRWENPADRSVRSFCARCGTPLFYERVRAPAIVNIPRALFLSRTGREPRYHIRVEEAPDWAWRWGPLAPLPGYPGVLWEKPGRRTARPAAARRRRSPSAGRE